jgi:hypothetical protein
MNIMSFPGGKGGPARKADNLTSICEPLTFNQFQVICIKRIEVFRVEEVRIILIFYVGDLHIFSNSKLRGQAWLLPAPNVLGYVTI